MTQITPIRGFTNTPVTKSTCILTTLLVLLLLLFQQKHYVKLAIDPFIVQYAQYWRIATFQMAVVNESDYLLCILLWFHFKTLERFFGPRKYLSLVAVVAFYNAIITFLVLCLGQLLLNVAYGLFAALVSGEKYTLVYYDTIFNLVALGPFGILSLLYMCFGAYIPVSYHFQILLRKPRAGASETSEPSDPGRVLTFTNHFQIHVLYTLLMLNHGISSILPCLVGLAVGRLYTQDLLAGSKCWALPSFMYRLFVNPRNLQDSLLRTARGRFWGYHLVSQVVEPSPPPQRADEEEVAIDDIRSNEENRDTPSEVPARTLGRQFLDTFRT